MEDQNIQKYAKLMQELGLTGLEINKEGVSLRLERAANPAPSASPAPPTPAQAVPDQPAEAGLDVRSPMVGVFYCAPAENAAPFVSVGEAVKKGDVLCIIEAMKLMNEITSEYDGTVTEVCAVNRQVVDYGHVLFRLKKERE